MTKAILKEAEAGRLDYNSATGLAVDIRQEGKDRWRHAIVLQDGMSAEIAGKLFIAFGTSILKRIKNTSE